MKHFVVFICLLFLLAACAPTKQAPIKEVTIGVILPLTGSGSDQGQWVKNGLELAKEELELKEGMKIDLVYEDSKGGNPKEAVTAYQAITQFHQIPAVITWGSGVGVALIPLANNDKIVQMGVATATPKYSTKDDYAFRVFPSADLEGKYNANLVYTVLGTQKVAIAHTNNDYGVGEKDAFVQEFEKLGGKIVDVEALNPEDTDFRTQILKIKELNPPLVFLAVYPKEGVLFLKQSAENALAAKTFASTAIVGGDVFKEPASEGITISLQKFDAESQDQVVRTFVDGYKAKYKDTPDVYHARAYDALYVIIDNLKKCTTAVDGTCLKNNLMSMTPHHGTTGDISFNEYGDITQAEYNLKTVTNGKLVTIQ